jgi:hypothetical protein
MKFYQFLLGKIELKLVVNSCFKNNENYYRKLYYNPTTLALP